MALSQAELAIRIDTVWTDHRQEFIKDLPVLLLPLDDCATLSSLPEMVRDKLGSVDQTKYAESLEGFAAVSLQFTREGIADFYMIGADVYTKKYKQVKLEEVAEKHSKLWAAASQYFQDGLPKGTIAGVKTGPVAMISTAALGFPKGEELKICAPWGEHQTKKADTDAWIVKETKEADSHFYMVNSDPQGMPIGYLPAEEHGK
eukprot:Skav225419  [mRNA]  locus=scaffold680:52372:52980:- [translate_table: standard]